MLKNPTGAALWLGSSAAIVLAIFGVVREPAPSGRRRQDTEYQNTSLGLFT